MEFVKHFYETLSSEQQRADSDRLRAKHPGRIPVIVDRADKHTPQLEKSKFLVPTDLTVGQFINVIRKHIKLAPEEALFFFTEDRSLVPISVLMSALFKEKANDGRYLILLYSKESTFGI